MVSLVRKWVSHLIQKHGEKFVKEVPGELLEFSLSSWSVKLERLDLQERLFENLDVLLPFEVNEAFLEDVAVKLCWRGSTCTIVIQARLLVLKARMRRAQDWESVLRTAPELQSSKAARRSKAQVLKEHEEKVLDYARRFLDTAEGLSLPHLELSVGGADKDLESGFQLSLEEEQGEIALEGRSLEILRGINLGEVVNERKAWKLDLQLLDLMASCSLEGRSTPCLGPAKLALELTFAALRGRSLLPDWPARSMTESLQEMDELPTVSLAVCSASCPVRATVAQVAFFAEHGLSWGRWFALKEALQHELCLDSDDGESPKGLGAKAYRQRWRRRLLEVRSGGAPDLDLEEREADQHLVAYEESNGLHWILRQRRLALLQPLDVGDARGGSPLFPSHCLCSDTASYDLLRDPTARHSFLLMVSLSCSEIELRGETGLVVVPTTASEGDTASLVLLELGVHDAPDLKPLTMRLQLRDLELRRRSLREASERSSGTGTTSTGSLHGYSSYEPPLLRVLGRCEFLMDLTEPMDGELWQKRSPRIHLNVEGQLQACLSYPLLLDLLELLSHLQLELLDAVSEDKEVMEQKLSERRRESQRKSSLILMPISMEDEVQDLEEEMLALMKIVETIKMHQLELPSYPAVSKDLRVCCLESPLTLLVPCARSIHGAEDRMLGATLEGLLILQLRVECQPRVEKLRFARPQEEAHVVGCKRIEATGVHAWLLPNALGREVLLNSFRDVELTRHRGPGHPLLLSCEKLLCDVSEGEELRVAVSCGELTVHLSCFDIFKLSLLAQSLGGGEAEEEDEEARPRVELDVKGVSLRIMQGEEDDEDAPLRVLARMDLGHQSLRMREGELRYSLEYLLLSDMAQDLPLLRWFGEGCPCLLLCTAADEGRLSLDVEDVQLLLHWQLCGACVQWYLQAQRRLVLASGQQAKGNSEPETPQLRLRCRVKQVLVYAPTFGEGLDEQGGFLLSCSAQLVASPTRQGPWKARLQVSQLSLLAVDSLDPMAMGKRDERSASCAILHPMRLQAHLVLEAFDGEGDERAADFSCLGRLWLEPIRVSVQPNHVRAMLVLQSHVDDLCAKLPKARATRASRVHKGPVTRWIGQFKVSLPVLRAGCVLADEPESLILVLEGVEAEAMTAVGTAINSHDSTGAAEQAAAAAAVAAASIAASNHKAAARAATASAAAAAAAAVQDAEEVTAADFCLQLSAKVEAIYADVVSSTGPEEQEMPLIEPILIHLKVPAYQGLRTKRRVWQGQELLEAFCPELSISWVNVHASEATCSVFAKLYSSFEVVRFKRRGGFSLHREAEEPDLSRERVTKQRGVQSLRNGLGLPGVLAVPQRTERRSSRMIAQLPRDCTVGLETVKKRANEVSSRVSRFYGKRQQRIMKSRTALLDELQVKSPVRSMLPVIARAEDFMAGAKGAVNAAVKDTVKRSNVVLKELRKAAAAEHVASREDSGDEESAGGTRAQPETAGNFRENFGLALVPGWPLAELRGALRHRARNCMVMDLPLLPSLARTDPRLSRGSSASRAGSQEWAVEEGEKEGQEALYDDEDGEEASEYSRSNSGWSHVEAGSPGLPPRASVDSSRGSAAVSGRRSSLWSQITMRYSRFDSFRMRTTRKLHTMKSGAQAAAGYASEAAAKAVRGVRNFAFQRKLKRGLGRREFTGRLLVRKVAKAQKDAEATTELELSSTIYLQNRSAVPLLVLPVGELDPEEDRGLLEWLVLHPDEPPRAVPLLWCVAQRVRCALLAGQQAVEEVMREAEMLEGAPLTEDSQVWNETEVRGTEAAVKSASQAFLLRSKLRKPLRPYCCPLSALEEAGVLPTETEKVRLALPKLLEAGAFQPLLAEPAWHALVGAKSLPHKREMLGRRLDHSLRGLCSTINGVGISRPRSPADSLFFLVTVEHLIRVCNRLCCSLEMGGPEGRQLAPGEDAPCEGLEEMTLELLLPAEGRREDDENGRVAHQERFTLASPLLPETSPRRSQSNLLLRKGNTCYFRSQGEDRRLMEVQILKEDGVVSEQCTWPDLHCTQFGSHSSQITFFVSHWLVNRATCSVVIPHPRLVTGLTFSQRAEEAPLMVVPGHSLRPLSEHALTDGTLEMGLRNEELKSTLSLQRSTTLRTRRSIFASNKSKTGVIRVDRPGKSGVLPPLLPDGLGSSSSLCLGFSVSQAPFPFYRTLVVEVNRRYTLVNLKPHPLWISDGTIQMELATNEPKSYHPSGGDQEFHLGISGVGGFSFTSGFRLSQLFNGVPDGTGRRGKLQLMYVTAAEAAAEGAMATSGQHWGLILVEALEVSSALIVRFSSPAKPQFRMVNRANGAICFRQDFQSAPLFFLKPEESLDFAWYSPPSFRSVAPESGSGNPALLLGAVVEEEEDLSRLPMRRYDIAQVREHEQLEFPRPNLRSDTTATRGSLASRASRVSRVVTEQLARVSRRLSGPTRQPDLYKVRTTVHQGSLEVHVFPWVRVSNATRWTVTVRADASQQGEVLEADGELDLWPPNNKNEMHFQMKRTGEDLRGTAFEWSQPLQLSERMTSYRGFFRQKRGGEADTVEVAVHRDEKSGFLRLRLSTCKQEPFLIENKSEEKCRFAPKNATGWVMQLSKDDGECPFFSHLWGGDTWMTLTISNRGDGESFDFDLSQPATHSFRDLIIEVKAKGKQTVVVKDASEKQKRLSRRSIREKGVLGTLNRMSVALRNDVAALPAIELGVQKLQSLASGPGRQVTFDVNEEPTQNKLFTTTHNSNTMKSARSMDSANPPRRFIEWVTMSSSITSIPTYPTTTRRIRCCGARKAQAPAATRRKKAMHLRSARTNLQGAQVAELDWSLDLRLEGLGVAMLDLQLDTRESHELGYVSLKSLSVLVQQVAAKTDVEGRAGLLQAELRLASLHVDVGTGHVRHQSKACHSVLRPFTGPLQILSETGEPPPLVYLDTSLKLVTENQEALDRDGSAHYEVRQMELKVQPLGLHIETALVSEVVLWVIEMSDVLKSNTHRRESHLHHLASLLDAEEGNLEDASLVDLRYREPRVVRDPTAEDFRDQTPVVIRELLLRKICCVMTLSFTGAGASERREELQALEMLLRLTLPLDVHQARLVLGKLIFSLRGWRVRDFVVRERFLSNGLEELVDLLARELTRSVLQQVPKLFGSQLLIGNPRRLGEELIRAMELGLLGITSIQPQVVLAAFLLGLAAFITSLRGMFLIVSKEACRASTGQVPDQLLREPARVRQSIAQALYYGLPWHCYRLAVRLRNRWQAWSQRCSICEGLKLAVATFIWVFLTPISALLVIVTKLIQALELISRRTARWASPNHVTAIGPPLPMRTGSQQFVAGYPKQFSGSAKALAALPDISYAARSDWLLRELPKRCRSKDDHQDEEELWGWMLLLKSSYQLVLMRPAQLLPGLRMELVDPPPEETWRLRGPFTRVEIAGDGTTLECHRMMSKVESLQLPCKEAALKAFELATENVLRG